ncbi:MAG: DUF2934 domain-containing protein [Steroidobacteraceae bacterium]
MATRRSADAPASAETSPRSAQPTRARAARAKSVPRVEISAEGRREMIAQAAYLRAERRGFAPGRETEDWLAAEQEVDALLKVEHGGSAQ